MTKSSGSLIRNKYDFRSDVLDIIIGGKSTIDSSTAFQVENLEDADRFISSYGYDLDNPIEKAEVFGNYHEALNFIRKYFLQPENSDGLNIEIPRKILELMDIRELFLFANPNMTSQNRDKYSPALRHWACSVLRVMHTIAHIDKDLRSSYFPDIQKQIFDRFYKLIHRDSDGILFLGEKFDDPLRINLVAFETKPKKSRESIILKLLHKPENVAEDIFDQVGIRFITHTPLDALRIIKYLKDKMVVMPPNIKPSRSRNTLIQLDQFRAQLGDLLGRHDKDELSEEQFYKELQQAALPPFVSPENPHSSEFYRAIQFTCRQLIKLRNPLYEELKDLKNLVRSKETKDSHGNITSEIQEESSEKLNQERITKEGLLKVIERIDLKHIQREIKFFYPFEVQVVDKHSAEENEKGRSAHSEYKRAQILTALKRVMGSLADVPR